MEALETRLAAWVTDLETRYLADLTFPEVSRSLRALSSTYVERRRTLREGAALSGAGKRAAFALFYGPLHFLLLGHIVRSLPGAVPGGTLIDLGCGTGAAGAACATAARQTPTVLGIDRHPWAVEEARRAYRAFGLRGQARAGDAVGVPYAARSTVLAAFVANELDDTARGLLLARLLTHAEQGGRVLVVEPLARFVAPWWSSWQRAFEAAGGRADQWRVHVPLPPIVEKLDRAAGLDHRELTGRSLSV